jgi:hypothetical protein
MNLWVLYFLFFLYLYVYDQWWTPIARSYGLAFFELKAKALNSAKVNEVLATSLYPDPHFERQRRLRLSVSAFVETLSFPFRVFSLGTYYLVRNLQGLKNAFHCQSV